MQKRKKTLLPFSSISLDVPLKVILTPGQKNELEFIGPVEIFEEYKVQSTEDCLVIEHSKNTHEEKFPKFFQTRYQLKMVITYNGDLSKVHVCGSGNCFISAFQENPIELRCNGIGDLFTELKVSECVLYLSGVGNAHLQGKVDKLSANIYGSGILDALELRSDVCAVESNGLGKIMVNVESLLTSQIKGDSIVEYRGNPILKNNIQGKGKVVFKSD